MTKKLPLPAKEYLDECLSYNKDTGIFTWRLRPEAHFSRHAKRKHYLSWIKQYPGKTTGTYRRFRGGQPSAVAICIDCKNYPAHRLAWVIMGNPDPGEMVIDHRDGNPFNNAYTNLRLATHGQNVANSRARKSGSGLKGASYLRPGEKKPWVSQMGVNGKSFYLGSFATKEEAHQAYCEAVQKHHGEFAQTA